MRAAVRVTAAVVMAAVGVLGAQSVASATHTEGHHWSHDGLARSQIYFVDKTGAAWPIATVTYKWNEAHGVDSYYETSCPSSTLHCVTVSEYSANDGLYGVTSFPGWNSASHNYAGVTVKLNDYTATTSTQKRKSSCHELGHVLGLAHRSTAASCMEQGAAPPISMYPDQHDFDELQAIYNHAN